MSYPGLVRPAWRMVRPARARARERVRRLQGRRPPMRRHRCKPRTLSGRSRRERLRRRGSRCPVLPRPMPALRVRPTLPVRSAPRVRPAWRARPPRARPAAVALQADRVLLPMVPGAVARRPGRAAGAPLRRSETPAPARAPELAPAGPRPVSRMSAEIPNRLPRAAGPWAAAAVAPRQILQRVGPRRRGDLRTSAAASARHSAGTELARPAEESTSHPPRTLRRSSCTELSYQRIPKSRMPARRRIPSCFPPSRDLFEISAQAVQVNRFLD